MRPLASAIGARRVPGDKGHFAVIVYSAPPLFGEPNSHGSPHRAYRLCGAGRVVVVDLERQSIFAPCLDRIRALADALVNMS
jgi:hypothetical protein